MKDEDKLYFTPALLNVLNGFYFKVNYKLHTNAEDEAKIIITMPEITSDAVEEFVQLIIKYGTKKDEVKP